MTKENQMDDLMQIAIEAGLIGKEPNGFDRVTLTKAEVRFAQLVAKKAVEAEREACAKLCEDAVTQHQFHSNFVCANAIRARASD